MPRLIVNGGGNARRSWGCQNDWSIYLQLHHVAEHSYRIVAGFLRVNKMVDFRFATVRICAS